MSWINGSRKPGIASAVVFWVLFVGSLAGWWYGIRYVIRVFSETS